MNHCLLWRESESENDEDAVACLPKAINAVAGASDGQELQRATQRVFQAFALADMHSSRTALTRLAVLILTRDPLLRLSA